MVYKKSKQRIFQELHHTATTQLSELPKHQKHSPAPKQIPIESLKDQIRMKKRVDGVQLVAELSIHQPPKLSIHLLHTLLVITLLWFQRKS